MLPKFQCNKASLGETGCLSNPQFLLVPQASSFLDYSVSLTQSLGPPAVPYYSLSSTHLIKVQHAASFVTNGFPPNPCIGKQIISLRVESILSMCLCPQFSLLAPKRYQLVGSICPLGSVTNQYNNLSLISNLLSKSCNCCQLLSVFTRPCKRLII